MNCLVLAAGYSVGLYPRALNFPKSLLTVAGKTLLDRTLDDLDRAEKIDRFVVVSNSRYFDSFSNWRDDKQSGSKKLSASVEILDDGSETNGARLGDVGDLLFAFEALELSGDALIVSGDKAFEFSLGTLFDDFEKRNATVAFRVPEPEGDSKNSVLWREDPAFEIAGDDRVSLASRSTPTKLIWRVPPVYLYRDLTAEKIRAALADGCELDALGSFFAWSARRESVFATEAPGRVFDFNDWNGFERVQAEFRER